MAESGLVLLVEGWEPAPRGGKITRRPSNYASEEAALEAAGITA